MAPCLFFFAPGKNPACPRLCARPPRGRDCLLQRAGPSSTTPACHRSRRANRSMRSRALPDLLAAGLSFSAPARIAQHDAQDLTQSFFAEMIETRFFRGADRAKGRFRSFLLGTLKHFVADARDRERAQKRGGGVAPVQLDEAAISQAEAQAARSNHWSADRVYEREWATALLRQALDRLQQECVLAGKGALFEALKSHLSAEAGTTVPYDVIAPQLGRPPATLRSDVDIPRALPRHSPRGSKWHCARRLRSG